MYVGKTKNNNLDSSNFNIGLGVSSTTLRLPNDGLTVGPINRIVKLASVKVRVRELLEYRCTSHPTTLDGHGLAHILATNLYRTHGVTQFFFQVVH